MTAKVKKIHALFGLTKISDAELVPLLNGSFEGLSENATLYSKPPFDLAAYQAGIRAYEGAIPAALDGSRTAIAQKNKLRDAVEKMYVELAHYVEANCNNDMATFLLSGFQPATNTKASAQPLDQPTIASVGEGPLTGQVKVKIGTVSKAVGYKLRYAPVPNGGGMPASWTEKTVTMVKPIVIENLTPGTIYTFQVCALGRLGFTDWSAPVHRMAI